MSRIDRRTLLKAGAVAGALAARPTAAALRGSASATVFDSRLAPSRAFARMADAGLKIDLAREHRQRFAVLRQGDLPARIEGLTTWSDWVALRQALAERGYRLHAEAPVRPDPSGRTHLFRWTLLRRQA